MVIEHPLRNSNGFSLIELLVALAILSMTILISSMGYSFFMEKWDGQLNKFDQQALIAKRLQMVRQALYNTAPYIVKKSDGKAGFFFDGNEDSFVGVTRRSIFGGEFPAVYRVKVSQADDFSYALVYQEQSLENKPLLSVEQPIVFGEEIALLSELSDIRIQYFGFENLTQKVSNKKQSWWKTYNGLQRNLMPATLGIIFIWDGEQQSLEIPLVQADARLLRLFNDDF